MEKTTTIGFIGAGNMAFALISGLRSSGFPVKNIKVSDKDAVLLSQRKTELGIEIFTDNMQLARQSDVIVFAVKPQILSTVCQELQPHINHQPLMISIVAGVKSTSINRWLGGDASIVRAMPNTPALLGVGATGMMTNDAVSKEQKALTEQILGSVGACFWVKDEDMINAVTALSGSGPAYFFLMIESMTKAGIALGLDEKIAEKLSVQTALGASMMASQSNDSSNELRAKVTSKNGTTQAAIESFQTQNFESVVSHAIRAAFDRAKKIGFELDDNA